VLLRVDLAGERDLRREQPHPAAVAGRLHVRHQLVRERIQVIALDPDIPRRLLPPLQDGGLVDLDVPAVVVELLRP